MNQMVDIAQCIQEVKSSEEFTELLSKSSLGTQDGLMFS